MASASSLPGMIKGAASSISAGNLSSSMTLSVDFSPAIEFVVLEINTLGARIKSFKVPLDLAVREVLVPSIKRNFDEGGRPQWPDLESATTKLREFYGYGESPLIRTGALRRVATQINMWQVDGILGEATTKPLPDKVWYGALQQEGVGTVPTSAKKEVLAPIKTPDQIRASGRRVETVRSGGYTSLLKKLNASGGIANVTASAAKDNFTPWFPARPFFVIQPEDELKIQAIFAAWIESRLAMVKI